MSRIRDIRRLRKWCRLSRIRDIPKKADQATYHTRTAFSAGCHVFAANVAFCTRHIAPSHVRYSKLGPSVVSELAEMDSRSFYGKRGLRMRLPPEDKSDDSCLSDSEDDDVVPYHHTQARVSSTSSEDEDEDAVDEPRFSILLRGCPRYACSFFAAEKKAIVPAVVGAFDCTAEPSMPVSGPGQGSPWSASRPAESVPLECFLKNGVSSLPVALVPTDGGAIRLSETEVFQEELRNISGHFLDISEETRQDKTSASRKRAVRWKKTGCQEQREVPPWESALPEADTVRAPIEYFKDFFDDNFMDHIVEQSNVFATQKNPKKGLASSRDKLDQFLGTVTFMSICRLPRSRLYWAAESRVPTVADTMSRDRWEAIKANLHFNNNDDMPPPNDPHKDRLFKVRPVIDFLLPKFQGIPKTQALCVDEQMVPFKGRSSLKQYIPSKPHKWGYKVFLLCDPQGMVHSFEIYTGRIDAVPGEADIGASGNIVLKLSQNIQPGLNHLLFCDNWFTSLKLFSSL
ncbi:hypothetical protein HPB51_005440 [Rhipicephalus microplus]|uniref:PiggyBac transposable element-derived protein domain-containing protein n=1 Tax=Rhipicephalus microplus TaxID=6941 RepID=A0A9J6DTD8_RHIMP|nr:hypothetical protein HPB51_005440 [Rhipicephalus microplus]